MAIDLQDPKVVAAVATLIAAVIRLLVGNGHGDCSKQVKALEQWKQQQDRQTEEQDLCHRVHMLEREARRRSWNLLPED